MIHHVAGKELRQHRCMHLGGHVETGSLSVLLAKLLLRLVGFLLEDTVDQVGGDLLAAVSVYTVSAAGTQC